MNRSHFIYEASSAVFHVSVGDHMHSSTVVVAICAKIPLGRVCQGEVSAGGSMGEVHDRDGVQSYSSQVRGAEQNRCWEPGSDAALGLQGRDVRTKAVGVCVSGKVDPRPPPSHCHAALKVAHNTHSPAPGRVNLNITCHLISEVI